jgi:hypothetical protein
MKRILCGALVIAGLLSSPLAAQRGGGGGGGRGVGGGGFRGGSHGGGIGIAGRGVLRRAARRFDNRNFGGFGGYGGYGWYGGFPCSDGWDCDRYYGSNFANSLGDSLDVAPERPGVMTTPALPPEPPPPPAQLVIHEYNWPASNSPVDGAFSIVSKDGKARLAIMVWAQDGALHYTSPDQTQGQIPLNDIDRAATQRANAEKSQILRLPPPVR